MTASKGSVPCLCCEANGRGDVVVGDSCVLWTLLHVDKFGMAGVVEGLCKAHRKSWKHWSAVWVRGAWPSCDLKPRGFKLA